MSPDSLESIAVPHAPVAQRIEQEPSNRLVAGSIPAGGTPRGPRRSLEAPLAHVGGSPHAGVMLPDLAPMPAPRRDRPVDARGLRPAGGCRGAARVGRRRGPARGPRPLLARDRPARRAPALDAPLGRLGRRPLLVRRLARHAARPQRQRNPASRSRSRTARRPSSSRAPRVAPRADADGLGARLAAAFEKYPSDGYAPARDAGRATTAADCASSRPCGRSRGSGSRRTRRASAGERTRRPR